MKTSPKQVQLLVWDYSDPCQMFPTLHFDLFVDTFFLVSRLLRSLDVDLTTPQEAARAVMSRTLLVSFRNGHVLHPAEL